MELMGSATHLRHGYGATGIEGEVARVATSKLGNERVSITNPAPNLGVIPENVCSVACLQSGQGSRGQTTLVFIGVFVLRFCSVRF